ncbi:hypothetical protein [Rhodovibrio salinarum]|uniref:hypothetical protein n=1 Tax=Rhodovibrio salinarum TaxID=1087 RepID=UPI0012DFA8AD|nr:hypothetical protein [Rhodovibrio salinarum]
MVSDRLIYEKTSENGETIRLYGHPGGDPEYYIEGVHGFMAGPNGVKLNLYTVGFSDTEGQRREVACRLAMSLDSFVSLAKFFQDRLKDIQENVVSLDDDEVRRLLADKAGDD